MSDNVQKLTGLPLTPLVLLGRFMEHAHDIEAVIVVAMDRSGEREVKVGWSKADVGSLAFMKLVLDEELRRELLDVACNKK